MADPNTEVVEQNVENVEACNTECSADSTIDRKSDWMYKRAKLLHSWDSTYFSLVNNTLYYGPSEKLSKESVKEIPLEGAEISECEIDKRDNVFSIKPKNSKRTYYIQANSDEHRTSWMEALCYAKVNGINDGNSEACVLQ